MQGRKLSLLFQETVVPCDCEPWQSVENSLWKPEGSEYSRREALMMHRALTWSGYRGMIKTYLVLVLNCKSDATSETPINI